MAFLYIHCNSIDLHTVKSINGAHCLYLFLCRLFCLVFFPRWGSLISGHVAEISLGKLTSYNSASLSSLAWIILIKLFLIWLQLLHLDLESLFIVWCRNLRLCSIRKLCVFVYDPEVFSLLLYFPQREIPVNYAQSFLSYWSLLKFTLSNTFSVRPRVPVNAKFSLCCFAVLISVGIADSCSDIKQVS